MSPLNGASVGNSTEDDESTFKMAHAGGWQVVAGCWVGLSLGHGVLAYGLLRRLLELPPSVVPGLPERESPGRAGYECIAES